MDSGGSSCFLVANVSKADSWFIINKRQVSLYECAPKDIYIHIHTYIIMIMKYLMFRFSLGELDYNYLGLCCGGQL